MEFDQLSDEEVFDMVMDGSMTKEEFTYWIWEQRATAKHEALCED